MAERVRTGVYSGSFNPIHIGHLALANWLCEFTELDEIWFVVSPHNPFKQHADLLDDSFRLELVRKAISKYPKFKACDLEFSLPRPSYTINTLRTLQKTYPDRDFYLIIGSDNWLKFGQWKSSEEITGQFPIIIYPRPSYPIAKLPSLPNVRIVPAPILEISSSFIRKSLKEGKDLRFFLPEAIWQDIPSLVPMPGQYPRYKQLQEA